MTRSPLTYFLTIILMVSVSIPLNAQFITLARKIKSKRSGDNDVATVVLEAQTFRVYQAVEAIQLVSKKLGIECTVDKH